MARTAEPGTGLLVLTGLLELAGWCRVRTKLSHFARFQLRLTSACHFGGGVMRYPFARSVSGFAGLLLIAASASAVSMAWTPIGNPGNACDQRNGCDGSVPYTYSIGIYEVTNSQYAEFLNAKAKFDPLGLYNALFTNEGNPIATGITRSGSAGSYTYAPIAGLENMPVQTVSFYDTLRFANWMNNGQGNADTETGGYTLLGGTPTPSNGGTVTRNLGAAIVLASEDEWYKAAYYDPVSSGYFDWPTGSNVPTVCAAPTTTPNRANCDLRAPGFTEVGAYPGSASPYGTFDQGGNVAEWNEAKFYDYVDYGLVRRGIRGGTNADDPSYLMAGDATSGAIPNDPSPGVGFRLVLLPEPTSGLLVSLGLLGLTGWRRVRA
jgi:formylglycine-generating enzyme required for sulfatase activity